MQMLGFVTHELKSPLASTQSMIAVMLEGFVEGVPDKVKNFLIRINRNSEELQDMVKNYLDLSRAERDELIANKSQINFHKEVVIPCVEQTQSLFDSRRVILTVTSPEDLSIHADPELMRIALTNYLTNAAKYGEENKQAILTVAEEQGFLTVSVWNEGAGFSTEEKERLFQKFSRLKNPNTANKRGSGLGLFLVKHILELHDGKVWAESESGQWAKFCFSFPKS
jgi:signal transduction histidine kinase